MGIDDVFYQCQTKTCSPCGMHQVVANAVKLFEDSLMLRFWNADPMVGHFNRDLPSAALDPNLNLLYVTRIVDSIAQQIQQCLGNCLWINLCRWKTGLNMCFQIESRTGDLILVRTEHIFNN